MPLNEILRGLLERYIDEGIAGIPTLVTVCRQGDLTSIGVKTMEDYIFGLVQGTIIGQFGIAYKMIYFQNPTSDIVQEVTSIIFRRSREIREAIFRQG
jgi:hypothetical protein